MTREEMNKEYWTVYGMHDGEDKNRTQRIYLGRESAINAAAASLHGPLFSESKATAVSLLEGRDAPFNSPFGLMNDDTTKWVDMVHVKGPGDY